MATRIQEAKKETKATRGSKRTVIAAQPETQAGEPVLKERRVTDIDKLKVEKITTIKATNDKEFHTLCQRIRASGDILAITVHNAGLYALRQVNIHGQIHHGVALIDALGIKHDKVRILKWMIHYGKFAYTKEKGLVYKKRKDINEATVEAWLTKADETPYWELTPQQELSVTFDYLALLQGLINKHNNVAKLEEAGKKVTEKNLGVLTEIQKLVKKFAPAKPKVA